MNFLSILILNLSGISMTFLRTLSDAVCLILSKQSFSISSFFFLSISLNLLKTSLFFSDSNLSIKYLLPNLIFINFINPFFIFSCLANSFFSFNLSWIFLQNLWIIVALSLHCIFLTILSHFIKVLYNLLLVIFSFFNKYIISNFLIFNNLSFSFLALYPL